MNDVVAWGGIITATVIWTEYLIALAVVRNFCVCQWDGRWDNRSETWFKTLAYSLGLRLEFETFVLAKDKVAHSVIAARGWKCTEICSVSAGLMLGLFSRTVTVWRLKNVWCKLTGKKLQVLCLKPDRFTSGSSSVSRLTCSCASVPWRTGLIAPASPRCLKT